MCVELYRQGKWPETPEGIKESNFQCRVRKWARNQRLPNIISHGSQMSTVSRMRIHQISEKYRGSCEFIGSKSVYQGEAPKNE